MEAAESSLFPGYRLDRYELLCPIASGGMASVWLARLRGKRGFEKLFAIKTIKTELITDPHYQQMFLDEARIASRIVHPNVAQILELGEENDILFLVMEFIDGDSLAKVHRLCLKQGTPLPVPFALRIVADICAGLHAAHQVKDPGGELLGVVHRDVSPQNVLLSSEGNAKVIDFGLVKARGRTSAETETGVVKGKIRYMAPEQVGGTSKAIDLRADVWAAGMCLLELVTGKQPYDELDDLDVVRRLMTPEAAPDLPADLSAPVRNVLAKALVRDREQRFASCGLMKRACEQALAELGAAVDVEDIASFVREKLPDLGAKRQRTIARAIEAADARGAGESNVPASRASRPALEGTPSAEMAFAATEVSARNVEPPISANFEDAVPLTRRLRTDAIVESDADRSGGISLREQLGESRKKTGVGYWVAGAVVVAVAAFLLFPRGSKPPPTAEPTPSTAASASAPAPTMTAAEIPPPSASAVTMELEPTPAPAVPDAGAKRLSWPKNATPPAPKATADAGPPKPKYNPAWSILTHPPEGMVPSSEAPPPPAPAPEPKPAE